MQLRGCGKETTPPSTPSWPEAIKGWRNRATAPRQTGALTADTLAIIGVLADDGLRRSEAAGLTWGDVELWAGRYGPAHDPEWKEPARTGDGGSDLGNRPVPEVDRPDNADPAAPVLGLTGEALASRVRTAAQAAGLGDRFTGHSGRIGMALRMVAAGAPNAAVQHRGRWKHGDMVGRYTCGEVSGEALEPAPRQLALWKAVQHAKLRSVSLPSIARELGIARNTVRRYAFD